MSDRPLDVLERDVKAACVARLRALGCLVASVGNRHRSQLPKGWPDTTVIPPRGGQVFFIEFKRARGGKVSAEQAALHGEILRRGKMVLVVRGVADLDDYLRAALELIP